MVEIFIKNQVKMVRNTMLSLMGKGQFRLVLLAIPILPSIKMKIVKRII